jgi:nucleolar pre-ribosomal-associated protein 1
VDGGVLENIETFLKADELDVTEVSHFLAKGFVTQAIQSWSYCAQVNDHAKFSAATGTLTKLLRAIGGHAELTEFGVLIIKNILTAYSKTLYRGLSNLRASLTNPILRLLNEIVLFKNGALLDDFLALFDFTLAVLPKLLIPSKTEQANVAATKEKEHLSIRYCFIRLLLNILKFSTPLPRKEFLANNTKILTNWFKFIPVIDSEPLIDLTITIWQEKILREPSFKKATKLKVFNEWNLMKLLPVYYAPSKEIRICLNSFILAIATDTKYGLKFAPDDSWFHGASNNAPIKVNQRNFRTHNKMLYGVLINLKPWDDDIQLNTTIKILSSIPELIPPYTNYLASRGLHDPKLTSYWVSQTLLLSRIINLAVPADIQEYTGLTAPSKSIVTELIVPSALNRSVLTKCLQSNVFLIRQLSAQLIMDSLLKLRNVIGFYESKGWLEAKAELINSVYNHLPDLATIAGCISDSYTKKKDSKILLVILLMIINGYLGLFSDNFNFSQAISKPYLDVINENEYTSINLVLLDNFFQLQEGDSSQIKWWNKSGKSNSLFTSLLKIATSNAGTAVASKVRDLLSNLVKSTVIFNYDQIKVDPIVVLIHSLQLTITDRDLSNVDISKVWTLLDESISRCVSSPFKYLDASNSHSRISPFIITLLEQWKFVQKTSPFKLISKWLVLFLRSLIIIGEPAGEIMELVSQTELDIDYRSYLFDGSFEGTISILVSDKNLKFESYYDTVTSSALGKLSKAGIPIEDLDAVGALARILSIVKTDSVTLKESEGILSDLLSNLGNYLYTHPESAKKFSQKKYWEALYLKNDQQKALLVSNALVQIFSQLDEFDQDDLSEVVKSNFQTALSEGQQIVLANSLWALSNEDVRQWLDHSSVVLKKAAIEVMIERKLTIESSTIAELLSYRDLRSSVSDLLRKDLVVFGEVTGLLEVSLKDDSNLNVLQALSKNTTLLPELVKFVQEKGDPLHTTCVACSLTPETVKHFDEPEKLCEMMEYAKVNAIELVKNNDLSIISFAQLCHIFSSNLLRLTPGEKSTILEYALEKSTDKFIPEISDLLLAVSDFQDTQVKTWLNKSVLYLTKILAEYPKPPSKFFKFLESFKILVLNIDVINVLSKSHVDALLEVVFSKWTQNEIALELASAVVISASRSFLEFGKLFQILANHNNSALLRSNSSTRSRFFTALLLWRLFEYDPSKNTNIPLQEKILTLYSGSTRPEDLLLFKILEKMESKLNSSWIDQVYSWDFMEDLEENEEDLIGGIRLIEKKREGFVITLKKKYVTNGLKQYNVKRCILEPLNQSNRENWQRVENFFKQVTLFTSAGLSDTVYDPLFLSLLIISNDELINITGGDGGEDVTVRANIKKLIESELLSSIILNLSSQDKVLQNVTRKVLLSLLHTLRDETTIFKEKHIFEVFITKILFTFENEEHAAPTSVALSLISKMVPILNNPGQMLYERVFRWVLKSPFIKTNEIPLYREITTVSSTEDTETYYKQLSWLLEALAEGIQTTEDIQLLRNKGAFEIIMNLLNSPYLNQRIRYGILAFINAVQGIEGGEVLVTRFGALSHLEQCQSSAIQSSQTVGLEGLQRNQELLNLQELSVRYGLITQKKRLRAWTYDDAERFTKRITSINKH